MGYISRMNKIDFDIITILQVDADMPLSQLSRRVGISKTALWNRLQRLEERGIVKGKIMALDRQALDLAVVVASQFLLQLRYRSLLLLLQ